MTPQSVEDKEGSSKRVHLLFFFVPEHERLRLGTIRVLSFDTQDRRVVVI